MTACVESEMSKPPDTLAARLIAARSRMAWSQHALADASGVSRSSIATIECGRTTNPSAVVLLRLARALEVDPRELMPPGG